MNAMHQESSRRYDELAQFVVDLYRNLGDRTAFDTALDANVTVWESADTRLLRGIDQLNELRGPAVAASERTSPLPCVTPTEIETDHWGDTGLIRYVLEVRESAGSAILETVRVTDVVRRSDRGWQIVHHHAQDLPVPAAS